MSEIALTSPGKAGRAAPLVTVAMPVYNAGTYLRAAVTSMIRQTFTDWELIIIDDGSTDGAVEGIQDLRDSRIRVLGDGSNRGLAARLNEAIDLACGRYFARMDQDDISYPERLASQLAMLEQNPELDLVAVRCVAINTDNELIRMLPYSLTHKELCASPWRGFRFPHPTWMGRIEWFRRYRYATPGPYLCEDQELLLRSYGGSRFATVPEVLFAYRVRSRTNWLKSFRARKVLAGAQLRRFLGGHRFGFGFLAVLVFVEQIALDSLNRLVQFFSNADIHHYRVGPIEAEEVARWHAVQKNLGCCLDESQID